MTSLKENYYKIKKNIDEFLSYSSLPHAQKTSHSHHPLIVVSKARSLEAIIELAQLGQIDFGENYVQEFLQKIQYVVQLRKQGQTMLDNIRWHYIGHLQSNKIKSLLPHVFLFHTLCKWSHAQLMETESEKLHLYTKVLLQINLEDEEQKSGISVKEIEPLLLKLNQLERVKVEGLMIIPPHHSQAKLPKEYFKELKSMLFDLNKKAIYKFEMKELSMGMSEDYQAALIEGATWVRVGRCVFE